MRSAERRGFGLMEGIVGLLIVALAGMTLLQSGGTIHKRSYLNEFHALASIRARTLMSFVQALDFDAVRERVARPDDRFAQIDLDTMFDGELPFAFLPPPAENPAYLEKVKCLQHEVSGRLIGRTFIELSVVVRWELPAAKGKLHEFRLISAMSRPQAAMFSK